MTPAQTSTLEVLALASSHSASAYALARKDRRVHELEVRRLGAIAEKARAAYLAGWQALPVESLL